MSPSKSPEAESVRAARALFAERPFDPHPLLLNGHLQTIVASQQRRKFSWGQDDVHDLDLELQDGTVVSSHLRIQDANRMTLIVVHGMAGSSQSEYMQALAYKASLEGWNSILFDLYDIRSNPSQRTIFHAGSSPKIRELVNSSADELGLKRIALVGVSMGGNMVLKLLGEWGEDRPDTLLGAAVISPLTDLTESWKMLDLRASNLFYRRYYVNRLKKLALSRFQDRREEIDLSRLESLRTIRDFDKVVTVPAGQFESVDEYYQQASSAPLLHAIRLPTLIIHSKDDPFLPWRPLTYPQVAANPNLMICLTRKGGHVGFIERKNINIDRSWAENRTIDFLRILSDPFTHTGP